MGYTDAVQGEYNLSDLPGLKRDPGRAGERVLLETTTPPVFGKERTTGILY
jgi:hypothetical protein